MAVASVERDLRQRLVLHLPLEVLYRILNHLELGDILAFRMTCKSLYTLCQSADTFEYLAIDRRINVKKLVRKGDAHYFVKTRSICLNSSQRNMNALLDGRLQSFPKLSSINLSSTPIPLKLIINMSNLFLNLRDVKLCVSVPHVFPGGGFWSGDQRTQLKLVLIGFLLQMLQTNTIRDAHLLFVLQDSICNIQSTSDTESLSLELNRMPRRVLIQNFALFHFEVTNALPLFSKWSSVEEFRLEQVDPGCDNFNIPISFSLPAECVHSTAEHRSIFIEHNALEKSTVAEYSSCLEESSFHRVYHHLNFVPEAYLRLIEYDKLSYLDLSHLSSSVTLNIPLESLRNLRGLNLFGQSSILLHILETVQNGVAFPDLTELNVAGIHCSQIFDRIRKQNLMYFISLLRNLKSLTLTPCMTLVPLNSIVKENINSDMYQPVKLPKFDTYGICIPSLFRFCPCLERLSVTDRSLVKCQQCVDEYSNLKQTSKFLKPASDEKEIPLVHFSLHYTQGIIDNYSAILLEEIASFQPTHLTHFSIRTNRNFLVNILCQFINKNPELTTLRVDCAMNFTPLVFNALKGLKYLERLFLIGASASEIPVLEDVIAAQPLLSIIWLHFKSLSAKQGKELHTRLMRLKEVRAAQDNNLTVNYSNRESPLADKMYMRMIGYLYSKSGIK